MLLCLVIIILWWEEQALEAEIGMLFVIGGDGSHRAALRIHTLCQTHCMKAVVVGIPKTIDNDILGRTRPKALCQNISCHSGSYEDDRTREPRAPNTSF
jgi:hypothetical protein